MASYQIITASAKSLGPSSGDPGLVAAVNALLAPIVDIGVVGWQFSRKDEARRIGQYLDVTIAYTTPGDRVLTSPFKVAAFSGKSLDDAIGLLESFMALHPSWVYMPPIIDRQGEGQLSTSPYLVFTLYSADPAASQNILGTGPAGPAAGDLSGSYPNPAVARIQGVPVAVSTPSIGQSLTFDGGAWSPSTSVRYFSSAASATAAAAVSPFLVGTTVIITATADKGTYQITSDGGTHFPADYTLISTTATTASDVGVVDAGGYFAATTVETALQEVGQWRTVSTQAVRTATVSGAVLATDSTILVDASAGAVVITIPSATAPNNGRTITVKKIDASASTVTLGGATIDGGPSAVISTQWASVTIHCNSAAAAWFVL
jgi:hypothetical protein